MDPNDDQKTKDLEASLFPEAGQRLSHHNFYSREPRQQEPMTAAPEEMNTIELDDICPECNSPLLVKEGTLGKYIACSRFPECKFTKPYDEQPHRTTQPEMIEEIPLPNTQDDFDRPTESVHTHMHDDDSTAYTAEEKVSEVEEPTGLPPEPYFKEPAFLPEESAITEQTLSEEPLPPAQEPEVPTAPVQRQNPEPDKKEVAKIRSTDRSLLLNHPVWLKKETVAQSSKWSELKQKRLTDQRNSLLTPAEKAVAGFTMPTPEEIQETLKKLEEDVQRLQQHEDHQRQTASTPAPKPQAISDDYDDDFDDVLPESLRQALSKKSNG